MKNFYDLDQIIKLDFFSDSIINTLKKLFNKRVYYKYGNNTRIGKLIGIDADSNYLIETNKSIDIIPTWEKLTKV